MSNIPDNILRDGTSQQTRNNSAVNPENVLVDGRDMEYYLRYIAKIAAKIRFYDRSNIPNGAWNTFFPEESEISHFLAKLATIKNLPPQQALFLAFTRLMEILRADINQLSKQHLNFYYRDVLRFSQQKAIAEKVNVIFEPGSNLPEPIVLNAGLELLAGKDENGNPIIFTTDKEFTVSKAAIEKISSIIVDQRSGSRIYAAPKADAADGLAAALPKEEPFWNPFGETQIDKSTAERTMIDGKVGFAIASAILLLREGQRKITITLDCRTFRLTTTQLDALRASIPEPVILQLQAVSGVLYSSQNDIEAAIIAAIGQSDFEANKILIFDQLNHPFKLIKDGDLEKAFIVEATGEKNWFTINDVLITKQLESQLRFQISLDVNDPAIVGFNAVLHKDPVKPTTPVIQFNLNHANEAYLYDELRGLKITNISIGVDVKGMTNLVLQSDNGPLNSTQAFLPFGALPTAGSVFYFGSREIFSKKLDTLQAELSWANLPKDAHGFQDYYTQYPVVPTNDSFTANFSVLDKRKWLTVTAAQHIGLFKTNTINVLPGDLPLVRDIFTINLPLPAIEPARLPEIQVFDPSLGKGFGKLVLNDPDFGHGIFPKVYAEKAILKATTIPAQVLPNTPYTPKINYFAINYSASTSFTTGATDDVSDKVLHVEPFGMVPMNEDTAGELLPQFPQGSLYIGLSNLTPPQNITLLFQMVDGSANPDIEVTRGDVKWNYFNNTKWKSLSNVSIQIDNSYGLQTSGIIELSINSDASDDAPFWANGLFWLRADFLKDPSGASKVASILTNAMVATLREDQVAAGLLKEPLPPGSITKLVVTNPQIKTVKQPFNSFAGRGIEPEIDFYRRVSERLRHKHRTVNIWDYEHLVLQAFPSIYKVKCLPHTGRGIEALPGAVTLLVIPDLRKHNKINPFEPKVSAVMRDQIGDYMTRLNSAFATVYVDNPNYEQVLVEMSVGLLPGFDGSFYGRLLNEELKRFLSPWAYEEGKDIVFGGKIFKSGILSFVEQREYVDYITNFKLYHLQRGPGIGDMRIRDNVVESEQDFIVRPGTIGEEMDFEVVASSARSILVTAQNHNIIILNPGEFVCPEAGADTGIGAMIIEVDFLVF